MNPPNPQSQNTALNFFGKALGIAVGFFTTMPLYHFSYEYFFRYSLRYSAPEYRDVLEMVWIICLFLLIFTLTWFVLSIVIGAVTKLFIYLALKLSFRSNTGDW